MFDTASQLAINASVVNLGASVQPAGRAPLANEAHLALTDSALPPATHVVVVMPSRLTVWTARLASEMRALAPYASERFFAGGSLMALMLLVLRHRVWLVACARQTLASLVAFRADSGGPR